MRTSALHPFETLKPTGGERPTRPSGRDPKRKFPFGRRPTAYDRCGSLVTLLALIRLSTAIPLETEIAAQHERDDGEDRQGSRS